MYLFLAIGCPPSYIKVNNTIKGSVPQYSNASLHRGTDPNLPSELRQIDDDISLFVSCFDIPVSLGSLFQRIASIDDGS